MRKWWGNINENGLFPRISILFQMREFIYLSQDELILGHCYQIEISRTMWNPMRYLFGKGFVKRLDPFKIRKKYVRI